MVAQLYNCILPRYIRQHLDGCPVVYGPETTSLGLLPNCIIVYCPDIYDNTWMVAQLYMAPKRHHLDCCPIVYIYIYIYIYIYMAPIDTHLKFCPIVYDPETTSLGWLPNYVFLFSFADSTEFSILSIYLPD